MQKKVIALAVAGLVSGAAFAQTSVTLSGTVDFGYNFGKAKWDMTGYNASHKFANFRGGDARGMSSSRLNIDVKEQLGSGLKAGFFHELGLRHFAGDHNDDVLQNTNNGISGGSLAAFNRARQSFAYLESASVGRFQIGWTNLITDDQTGFANVGSRNFVGHAYNASFWDPATGRGSKLIDAMDQWRANAVSYYSPVFSGFQVMGQFGHGKSEVDVNGVNRVDNSYKIYNIGLKYANGPMRAYLGAQKYDADPVSYSITLNGVPLLTVVGNEDRREFIVAASYDFGPAKLAGVYFDRKSDIDLVVGDFTRKYRGGDIGVSVPMGQAALFANYGMGKNKIDDLSASWKIRTYQVGARYNLSKRTNVYAVYGHGKAKGDDEGTGKRSVASVGMRHSF